MSRVLSTEDLKRLMAEDASERRHEVRLYGVHFSEINLDLAEIPVSLDLDFCRIDGDVNLRMAKFYGSYISLDGADIGGRIILSGMRTLNLDPMVGGRIGLYLRGARVGRQLYLGNTRISSLHVSGTKVGTARKEGDVIGLVPTDGCEIDRIYLASDPGVLEEIREKKGYYRRAWQKGETFPPEPE